MTSARDSILQAIREVSGPPTSDTREITAEANALLADAAAVRPGLSSSNIVDSFMLRVTGPKVGATAERIASIDELPGAVASYLADLEHEPNLRVQPTPALMQLDWQAVDLQVDSVLDDGVFVVEASLGIAETGTVAINSASDQPILASFLCGTQIVVIHADAIVSYLEDYAEAVRTQAVPRNACLITGASGTTDIEGRLVKGAHGPRDLHIIVVGEPRPAAEL